MKMKLVVGIPLVLTIVVLTAIPLVYKTLQVPAIDPHYHANFAIVVDGHTIDFSAPSYMSIQPCTEVHTKSSDPLDNVHLHDQIGNVVHVHAEGITWNHLLTSLRFDPDKGEHASASTRVMSVYRNGEKRNADILADPIAAQDRLLIYVASQSGAERVNDDPVIAAAYASTGANASEYDSGTMGTERCGSDTAARSFWQRFRIAFHF